MALNANAASGQGSDNAGSADPLQAAIDAASAQFEGKDTVTTPDPAPVAKDAGKDDTAPAKDTKEAGDSPTGEDTPKAKPEAKDSKTEAVSNDNAKVAEAPKHWADADKQAFAKLPKDGQEVLLKLAKNLEGGFTRKSQELSDKAKFAETVRGLFDEPTRALMAKSGADEVATVQYLLGRHQHAASDPVGYVKWFMQQTGISADHLGFSQTNAKKDLDNSGKSDETSALRDLLSDPEVKPLKDKQAALEATIGDLTQKLQAVLDDRANGQRQLELEGVQRVTKTVADFRTALDDSGQLAHPHFDSVSKHMGALMDTDPTLASMPEGPEKLKAAYDMAVYAVPELRAGLLETERTKAAEEARKKDEAERAKRITAVKPSVGVNGGKVKSKGLDSIIAESMQKAGL